MQKPIHAVDSLSSLDLYLGYCDEEYDDDYDCNDIIIGDDGVDDRVQSNDDFKNLSQLFHTFIYHIYLYIVYITRLTGR